MIRFTKEKLLLLHQIMAQATGGSMDYEGLLEWVKEHSYR